MGYDYSPNLTVARFLLYQCDSAEPHKRPTDCHYMFMLDPSVRQSHPSRLVHEKSVTPRTSVKRYMMRQAIVGTSRFTAIQYVRALTVGVSYCLELVEVIEERCERIAALEVLGWQIALGTDAYNETRVPQWIQQFGLWRPCRRRNGHTRLPAL
jgi:hypothetical protein